MSFSDKIVLVTGSTRGIGFEIAKAFATQGATVIITGRQQPVVDDIVKKIVAQGLKADGFALDVTNAENVAEIVNKILDKHKGIDILVNNAGITKDNLLLRMTESDWNEVININLKGVFNCTKVVTKVMLKQASAKGGSASGGKKGKVINIASVVGMMGNAGQANYAATKAGIIGFTKSVAIEFASRGITVNAVAPGFIQTDMTDQLSDKAREVVLSKIPLGRLGHSSDVANVCLFLASEGADYITGQTIVVDGGFST